MIPRASRRSHAAPVRTRAAAAVGRTADAARDPGAGNVGAPRTKDEIARLVEIGLGRAVGAITFADFDRSPAAIHAKARRPALAYPCSPAGLPLA